MAILEGIVVGLSVHLGAKLIDKAWDAIKSGKSPIVDQNGNLALTASQAGTTLINREFTVSKQTQAYELITGKIYRPASISNFLTGYEIPLVLIIEETRREVLLFKTDLYLDYEIRLSHGIYSFFLLLMDSNSVDFYDAEIYAIGFPSTIDLSNTGQIYIRSHEDIWNWIDDSPQEITAGGPYILDFILVDTIEIPNFPQSFSGLLPNYSNLNSSNTITVNQIYNLTGSWELQDWYQFGSGVGNIYLVHAGSALYGVMVVHDLLDDGTELIVEETVAGTVQGKTFLLAGTGVRIHRGLSQQYFLDNWQGVIESSNLVRGYSRDEAGTEGEFTMRR